MIRTVIFDLGRVLIPFDFQRGYAAMSDLTGLAPQDIRSRLHNSGIVPRFESGQIAARDFVSRVGEILESDLDYSRFCDIWSCIFLPHTLVPETMVESIRRKYRTVLLSNTNEIHFNMVSARYPILQHFDAYVLSHEVGAMKPDPRIYQHAIDAAQCAPPECFFTDDIEDYVHGARAMGIDAVQFQNAEQIEDELRRRGVNW
jgi:putative hydrolase of the HAD superfamily